MNLFGLVRVWAPMRALLVLLCAALVSGCVANGAVSPTSVDDGTANASAAPFSFTATDCVAGGFASSYPGPLKLAGIWDTADIREELGNPLKDSSGRPVIGPLMGNWHIGFECASAEGAGETFDTFEFGWVGQMVEPPAWDVGGADVHYLLTGLAFDEGAIGETLRRSTTADVTHVEEVTLDWLTPKDMPRATMSARFVDRERGVYESWSDMELYRDVEDRVIRFWWQVPADGTEAHSGHQHTSGQMEGQFNPMYFDLHVAGGAQYVTPQSGVELASHNMLKMEHGPVIAQPCSTLFYEHETLEFTVGSVFEDVMLDAVWTH